MSGTASPILVTGVAGFIGFHVTKRLLERGDQVIGLDNVNDYYDVRLKEARLAQLANAEGYRFLKLDLADREGMKAVFEDRGIKRVFQDGSDEAGNQQDVNQWVVELQQEALEGTLAFFGGQYIQPKAFLAVFYLEQIQPLLQICIQ